MKLNWFQKLCVSYYKWETKKLIGKRDILYAISLFFLFGWILIFSILSCAHVEIRLENIGYISVVIGVIFSTISYDIDLSKHNIIIPPIITGTLVFYIGYILKRIDSSIYIFLCLAALLVLILTRLLILYGSKLLEKS
jgi:hypothetical protein